MIRASVAALALLALTSCGGSDSGGSGGADAASATDIAASLQGDIPTITKTVEITEDNDPNGDIGRPNQYSEAVSIYDSRTECDSELDVTCGAKIEVWEDEGAAQDRADYIQGILEASPMLGAEYDYVDGNVLLRVTGNLKPSEADEYEAAFTG